MGLKIDERDKHALSWLNDSITHRTFTGGWREVQKICYKGQLNSESVALLPPMAVEMRRDENGKLYQESIELYRRRVGLTILTNFYARTALFFTGLVFEGGKVKWDLPDKLQYLIKDIDGHGTSASQFFSWQFYKSLTVGAHCCYVNSNKPLDSKVALASTDKSRVIMSDIPAENILGGIGNTVRISARRKVPDDDWGWDEIDLVYVISDEEIEIYEKPLGEGEYRKVEGYPVSIPYRTCPASFLILGPAVGSYHGIPVLDDLAGLQLEHLHTKSQDAQYREACNWLWVHSHGYDLSGGVKSPLTTWTSGQWEVNHITGENDKWGQYKGQHPPFIKISEPSGKVSDHNRKKLEEIKADAALWGMMQLRPDGVSFSTATSHHIAQKSNTSSLSMWAEILEAYIQRNFEIAGKMENVPVSDKVCVLEKDYSNVQLDQFANYLKASEQGIISKQTVFNTIKRAGGIETVNDWESEEDQINDEEIKINQTRNTTGVN